MTSKHAPVIARCTAPSYCVKMLGSRHLLLGGGGGAAKTGVLNHIQTFLLFFDKEDGVLPPAEKLKLAARPVGVIDTSPHATMNMDCVSVGAPGSGKYLLAAGHDQYCDIYESTGFSLTSNDGKDTPSLTLKFEKIARIISDEKVGGSYQKTVRFDRSMSNSFQRLCTGGADGCIRVWDVDTIRKRGESKTNHKCVVKIDAHTGDIDDLDISPDGKVCLSIGHDAKFYLWDIINGRELCKLSLPPEINEGFRVRSARFTTLGTTNMIFVAVYNQIKRTKKSISYATLWAYNRERNMCRPILVREVCKDTISALVVSECGNYFAIGTLSGSVGIYDTHELKVLYFARETHKIFVTGVEFLSRKAYDFAHIIEGDRGRNVYPGVASEYRAAVVSLSADQTVQLHAVPYYHPTPFTVFWLRLSVVSVFLYYIVWYIRERSSYM